MQGNVEAVAKAPGHQLGKRITDEILLFAGLGVGGDAHAGTTVKHRSRARVTRKRPTCARSTCSPPSSLTNWWDKGLRSRPARWART
jgi:hypothetical protein